MKNMKAMKKSGGFNAVIPDPDPESRAYRKNEGDNEYMKKYRLKVSLMGRPRLYRVIEASENATLENLHDAIFDAYERYDPHLYSFFLTRKDTKSVQAIYQAPEFTHPRNTESFMGFGQPRRSAAKTRISELGLAEKDVFHYLFDFGDDWWHRIRVESVMEVPGKGKFVNLVKSVGEAPDQYPDYDEDDDY